MKKGIFALLGIGLLALASCQKDPVETPGEATKTKILGKWMLERALEEQYDAANVRTVLEDYTGTEEDSIVFRKDNTVYMYSQGNMEQSEYKFLDANTIQVEQEVWKIEKLTETEFDMYSEEVDPVTRERYVQRLYHKR